MNGGHTNRLIGLIAKESRHLLRDKHLLFLLVFPPTIQLLILGAALDPGVRNLPMGVFNRSQGALSEKLVSSLTATGKFQLSRNEVSLSQLKTDLNSSKIKVGLVIPTDFEESAQSNHTASIEAFIDGVDAYSATLASDYLRQGITAFRGEDKAQSPVESEITTLYNPNLKSAWYFIPGVMGAMLTLTSTLVASATLLREKELGTLEQLLMTPYRVWEILLAKLTPLFFFLMLDAVLAVIMGVTVFGVPFRGSLPLFGLAAALYVCVGMGLGMMLATLCKTERQAHLLSFFVVIPVLQLSGAVVPCETMPEFLRQASALDPLRYFTEIARSLMLKGTDIHTLWPELIALGAFAIVLFTVSLVRFRSQLS